MKRLLPLLPWMLAAGMWAQDPPQPQGGTPRGETSAPQGQGGGAASPAGTGAAGKQAAAGTSKDRLFWALPNFLTLENAGKVPPLSAGEKFRVTVRSSFDPVEFFWYGALAGISQWEGSESGYRQGAEGYGKRYGAYFADGTIENFLTSAMLPSLLRQDPRYFQLGKGGFWHRAGYAIGHIVVTRSDSGHSQFNFSEVFGSAMASGISTYTYHPAADHNLPNAMSVWGSEVGYDALTFVVKEFWPDIRRKLHKPKTAQVP